MGKPKSPKAEILSFPPGLILVTGPEPEPIAAVLETFTAEEMKALMEKGYDIRGYVCDPKKIRFMTESDLRELGLQVIPGRLRPTPDSMH